MPETDEVVEAAVQETIARIRRMSEDDLDVMLEGKRHDPWGLNGDQEQRIRDAIFGRYAELQGA